MSLTTDVLIIGGSHAGLAVALTLYRALHTCVVFDSHAPRNPHGTKLRLNPTWDGKSASQFLEAAREELRESGLITFEESAVESIEKLGDNLFHAKDSKGKSWEGRKVVFATGVVESFPNIEGYNECYTKGIFPCMFQFGYELRGASTAGLLAVDNLANPFHAAMLANDGHKFAENMVIYTNSSPSLAAEIQKLLQTRSISIDDRPISRLTRDESSQITLEFEDGAVKTERFLVHRARTKVRRTLPDQLGLDYGPMGDIKVSQPFNETSVAGVFAVGDCASPMKSVPNAINMGAYAGAGLARALPRHVTGNDYK